jgi:hypothetical protein
VEAVLVVEQAVRGLADDRQGPRRPGRPWSIDHLGHQRVAHHPDAVRVGEGDGRGQHPRLADPLEPGHLAVAVEAVAAGEHRLVHVGWSARDDHRDAGPDRPVADHQWTLAFDEGGVADTDAWHVGDGVVRAGLTPSDHDPEVSSAHRTMLTARPGRTPT